MIDITNIQLIENYVLILPDPNYTEFHYKGKNTGLLTTDFIYDAEGKRTSVKERNFSCIGTVYAIPKRLRYDVWKARKIGIGRNLTKEVDGQVHIVDKHIMQQIQDYRRYSVDFETECELEVGDRARFSYTAHKQCEDTGAFIETELGRMYFMKYDKIQMSINEDLSPKRMVNGYILVEPDEIEMENQDGVEGKTTDSGLFMPNLKGHRERKSRKAMVGTVLAAGKPIKGYKQLEPYIDPQVEIEAGEKIMFDPRGAVRLEMMNHQEWHEKELYLLQRHDVFFLSSENSNFEQIGIERLPHGIRHKQDLSTV